MSRSYGKTQKMKLIEQMQTVSLKSKDELHRRDASEVVQFFIRNGHLPGRMVGRCFELAKLNEDLFPKSVIRAEKRYERHYLYAIQCGERVKIGYSVDPERRMRRMQTGNAEKMVMVWRVYAAEDSREARYQERKLHRYLKDQKIRGEWFDAACIPRVKTWKIKNREAKEERTGKVVQSKLDAEFSAIIGGL